MSISPSHADANDRDRWDQQLADAFGILLGRPLDQFDPKATYTLYHWADMEPEDFFGFFGGYAALGSIVPSPDEADTEVPAGHGSVERGPRPLALLA